MILTIEVDAVNALNLFSTGKVKPLFNLHSFIILNAEWTDTERGILQSLGVGRRCQKTHI